jgi:hypothetical protein
MELAEACMVTNLQLNIHGFVSHIPCGCCSEDHFPLNHPYDTHHFSLLPGSSIQDKNKQNLKPDSTFY